MLSVEKVKTSKIEKRRNKLMGKSLAIVEMKERLNALFDTFMENANSGVGKKIRNLMSGKH